VVWTARLDAYGKVTTETGTVVNNLRFPGQYHDRETGLYYNWHRYYSPELGRYITSDPIGLEGGLNTYGYVGGNPVNAVDPMGLDFLNTLREANNVLWYAGPLNLILAHNAALMAAKMTELSGLPGNANGPADAYRHCIWTCVMGRSMSPNSADFILWNHEDSGNRVGQPLQQEQMDEKNNQVGLICATENQTITCTDACMQKLLNGDLYGLGGLPLQLPSR
jgi:RHS repeat-associated protein